MDDIQNEALTKVDGSHDEVLNETYVVNYSP